MAKYLDSNGLLYFWGKCKAKFLENVSWDSTNRKLTKTKNGTTDDLVTFAAVATSGSYTDLSNKPTIPSVPSASTATPNMDGTASAGTSTSWSRGDHVHPTDTSRAASSHTHGSITNAGAITSDTTVASGDKLIISDSSDSSKLKRSNVSFGTSTTTYLRNDGTWGTPAGSSTDTKVTQTLSAGNSTYPLLFTNTADKTATSTDTARFTTSAKVNAYTGDITAGMYNGVRVEVNSGGSLVITDEENVGVETSEYFVLGGACEKDVSTSVTSGDANLITSGAVYTYVNTQMVGALHYAGTATSNSSLGTAYKKGYYWIVGSAGGTIAGQTVEAGDMVLAHADYSGTVANDVDIVQSNIDRITDSDIDTIVAA